MADQPGTEKKKRSSAKKITFIYTDESGKVRLKSSTTMQFSVEEAWKEANKEDAKNKLIGAVNGHVSLLENKLRKPTYAELQELAGL
jgi:hypothetical protein